MCASTPYLQSNDPPKQTSLRRSHNTRARTKNLHSPPLLRSLHRRGQDSSTNQAGNAIPWTNKGPRAHAAPLRHLLHVEHNQPIVNKPTLTIFIRAPCYSETEPHVWSLHVAKEPEPHVCCLASPSNPDT